MKTTLSVAKLSEDELLALRDRVIELLEQVYEGLGGPQVPATLASAVGAFMATRLSPLTPPESSKLLFGSFADLAQEHFHLTTDVIKDVFISNGYTEDGIRAVMEKVGTIEAPIGTVN
jgi:hypothetical protein